MFLLT